MADGEAGGGVVVGGADGGVLAVDGLGGTERVPERVPERDRFARADLYGVGFAFLLALALAGTDVHGLALTLAGFSLGYVLARRRYRAAGNGTVRRDSARVLPRAGRSVRASGVEFRSVSR